MLRKLSVFCVLAAVLALIGFALLRPAPAPPKPQLPPPPVPAILGAHWGESMEQVQAASGAPLTAVEFETRFYTPPNFAKNTELIQAYETDAVPFLNRPAKITFVFFKNRLFMYRIFLRSNDAGDVNQAVTEYLQSQYGAGFKEGEGEPAGKIIWQTKDLLVNYWFYEDELKLREKMTAGFAVIYQPIEGQIR